MLKKLKDNFDSGVEKIKWFSSLLSDRLKIEISVMKLLHQSEQMEKKKDDLMKTIGRRVYELKEYPDSHALKDTVVTDALNEIEVINAEIESLKRKASEISKIEG
jgi:seryl-tRNA synthetase